MHSVVGTSAPTSNCPAVFGGGVDLRRNSGNAVAVAPGILDIVVTVDAPAQHYVGVLGRLQRAKGWTMGHIFERSDRCSWTRRCLSVGAVRHPLAAGTKACAATLDLPSGRRGFMLFDPSSRCEPVFQVYHPNVGRSVFARPK